MAEHLSSQQSDRGGRVKSNCRRETQTMKTGSIRQRKQESRERKEDSRTEPTAANSKRAAQDEVGEPC